MATAPKPAPKKATPNNSMTPPKGTPNDSLRRPAGPTPPAKLPPTGISAGNRGNEGGVRKPIFADPNSPFYDDSRDPRPPNGRKPIVTDPDSPFYDDSRDPRPPAKTLLQRAVGDGEPSFTMGSANPRGRVVDKGVKGGVANPKHYIGEKGVKGGVANPKGTAGPNKPGKFAKPGKKPIDDGPDWASPGRDPKPPAKPIAPNPVKPGSSGGKPAQPKPPKEAGNNPQPGDPNYVKGKPKSNNWSDIVGHYFPRGADNYKAGGLVRGGGVASKGRGRGRMC